MVKKTLALIGVSPQPPCTLPNAILSEHGIGHASGGVVREKGTVPSFVLPELTV
jgi:hypothetical protein